MVSKRCAGVFAHESAVWTPRCIRRLPVTEINDSGVYLPVSKHLSSPRNLAAAIANLQMRYLPDTGTAFSA